jgi:hypothetical protein
MPEPVVGLDTVKAAVAAVVVAVWQTAPDSVVQVITAVVGVLLFAGLTWFTRNVVTPLSNPKNADGVQLVAVGRHAAPEG